VENRRKGRKGWKAMESDGKEWNITE